MLAIHPAQVDVINEAFTPTAEELAEAQEIVDLFAANPGVGTIGHKGAMLDRPHLARAQALLALGRRADDGHRPTPRAWTSSEFLRPGDRIVLGQACGEPTTLVEALIAQADEHRRPVRLRGHQLLRALHAGGGRAASSLSSMGAIGALRTLTASAPARRHPVPRRARSAR